MVLRVLLYQTFILFNFFNVLNAHRSIRYQNTPNYVSHKH